MKPVEKLKQARPNATLHHYVTRTDAGPAVVWEVLEGLRVLAIAATAAEAVDRCLFLFGRADA